MLVLSRRVGQKVVIGNGIVVVVKAVSGDRVQLGFEGPDEVPIHRAEVAARLLADEPADEPLERQTHAATIMA